MMATTNSKQCSDLQMRVAKFVDSLTAQRQKINRGDTYTAMLDAETALCDALNKMSTAQALLEHIESEN